MSSNSKAYTIHSEDDELQLDVYESQAHLMTNRVVEQLKKKRKQLGLTQQDVADATGMKTPNVTRIESMKHEASLEGMLRMAQALGMELKLELSEKKK